MKKMVVMLLIGCIAMGFTIVGNKLFICPKNFPPPTYDFTNSPLQLQKIALGRKLFYDPILSKDNTISCSSCHLSYTGFAHIDHQLSHGIGNAVGTRNASTLINLAWAKNFMWDGQITNLNNQAITPITHPAEMGETMTNVLKKIQKNTVYAPLFTKAFNTKTITQQQILQALTQFLLTLISANSKYDKVMRHDANFTFTNTEARGYDLFKTHCNSCHTEPLFTNNSFENNGLQPDTLLNDWGRYVITHQPKDSLKFKVPTLRNVEVSYPYMHDGRYLNLQMVLFHYTNNIHKSGTLASKLQQPLLLSEQDKESIIAFLKTLTDQTFLQNPQLQPYNN
jgi:cytochrome c peroxidase